MEKSTTLQPWNWLLVQLMWRNLINYDKIHQQIPKTQPKIFEIPSKRRRATCNMQRCTCNVREATTSRALWVRTPSFCWTLLPENVAPWIDFGCLFGLISNENVIENDPGIDAERTWGNRRDQYTNHINNHGKITDFQGKLPIYIHTVLNFVFNQF